MPQMYLVCAFGTNFTDRWGRMICATKQTSQKFQMYFFLRCTLFSDVLFGANYTDRLGRMICAAKQASQKFQSGPVNHQTSDILDWTFYILCFNKIPNYISVYNSRSIDAIVHATHNLIVLMIK